MRAIKDLVLIISLLTCQIAQAQKASGKKIFISLATVSSDLYDKMADSSSALVVQNVDTAYLTSFALLRFSDEPKHLLKKKELKRIISYDSLVSIIKNAKLDFMDKFEFYIVERNDKGQYVALKVWEGNYLESKDKTMLELLSEYMDD